MAVAMSSRAIARRGTRLEGRGTRLEWTGPSKPGAVAPAGRKERVVA